MPQGGQKRVRKYGEPVGRPAPHGLEDRLELVPRWHHEPARLESQRRGGAFDLRLTYMAAEPIGFTDRDVVSRLWMIGGIYQLTPRVRVNADAFTSNRDFRSTASVLSAPANAAEC